MPSALADEVKRCGQVVGVCPDDGCDQRSLELGLRLLSI